jgi:hypothetical protein
MNNDTRLCRFPARSNGRSLAHNHALATGLTPGRNDALYSSDLPRLLDAWLLHCDVSRYSERTIETRRERVGKLIWFLVHKEHVHCGLQELRAFFPLPQPRA